MNRERNILYVGLDRVAMYDYQDVPEIGIPPGWPESDTFSIDSPIFSMSPEELKEKYKVSFPIHWKYVQKTLPKDLQHELYCGLSSIGFKNEFPNGRIKVQYDTIKNLTKKGIKFYYIIRSMSNNWYGKPPVYLGRQVADAVDRGLCTVLFTLPTEGYMNTIHEVRWLSEFAKLNKLNSNNFIFSHSNLKFQETIDLALSKGVEIRFKYLPTNYFEYNLWFLNGDSPYVVESNKQYKEKLSEFIEENRCKNFNKYFNILNRVPRLHRILLFTEVMSSSKLKEKTEISLGSDGIFPNSKIVKILEHISNSYPEYIDNYNFSKLHDFSIPTELDVDLSINRAPEFTREFYRDSFMSIITETLIEENILFFSEKIFKPIYNLHPFILLGNPFSLQKLKDFGYKTFENWWDESYDLETDYLKRIKKISRVMETIASWSKDECISITQEMEEILVHNFYNLLDNKRYENYIIKLLEYQNNTVNII